MVISSQFFFESVLNSHVVGDPVADALELSEPHLDVDIRVGRAEGASLDAGDFVVPRVVDFGPVLSAQFRVGHSSSVSSVPTELGPKGRARNWWRTPRRPHRRIGSLP